ncbi:MAG: TrmH family RNA methyltransferase [Planctomycetaceae bacterium]
MSNRPRRPSGSRPPQTPGKGPRPSNRRPGQQPDSQSPRGQGTAAPFHGNDDEQKICGFHACLGVFQRRPDDIIKVYLTEDRTRHVSALLKWCAANRRAYNVVADENLERLSGSSHHEGIMILTRKPAPLDDRALIQGVRAGTLTGPFLYLDGLQNPHNLGALLRTAAHFAVSAILGSYSDLPEVSAATSRVAEGGAEHVPVIALLRPEETLAELQENGFVVLATSSHQGRSIYKEVLTPKTIFVLGGEHSGVSGDLIQLADRCLLIPGTGHVESLNVSVAGAVLLSELYRQVNSTASSEKPSKPGGAGHRRPDHSKLRKPNR